MTDQPLIDFRQSQSERIVRVGRIFVAIIIVMMVGLLGRVVQLKVAPNPRLHKAVGTSMSTRMEITRRGDLLDRMGRVVATSTVGYKLFIDPEAVGDRHSIAIDLGKLLAMNPVHIDQEISRRPSSRYIVLSHDLQDWQIEAVRRANLKGVGLDPILVRHYPHVDLAAGAIGKVGYEHTGLAGFERVFNQQLAPSPGKLTYLRDVARRALWIDPQDYEPGRNGRDIRLSIDLVIQEIAEKRIRRAMEEFNAGGGRVVVMDTTTGEILAMADFINHRRGWTEQITDSLRKLHPALGRNRCISDPYEPGSTFKAFIWAVATETGKAKVDEVLQTPTSTGWRTPYGRLIRDVHYYGPLSWRMVLVKSLNTGMAMIAERMTHRQMQEAVKRFGFGSKTQIGLPGETAGIVTSPKQWRNYTQSSVAMGHEIAVTPVQMVRAFSVFCRNDGTIIKPRVTAVDARTMNRPQSMESEAALRSSDRSLADLGAPSSHEPRAVQESGVEVFRQVLKPQTVMIAREAMKGVMHEGTGRAANSTKYEIFGKSGTAQLPKADRKGYHQDRYVASFIAAAPYEQPQIVVLCVLDDPDKSRGHYGGAIVGPVVRDIIDETLTYLGVAPDLEQKQDAANMVAQAR